jgi:hypothetical protein
MAVAPAKQPHLRRTLRHGDSSACGGGNPRARLGARQPARKSPDSTLSSELEAMAIELWKRASVLERDTRFFIRTQIPLSRSTAARIASGVAGLPTTTLGPSTEAIFATVASSEA